MKSIDEIIEVVCDIYEEFQISEFGFDLKKLIKDMGINLIPYSAFNDNTILKKIDEDGFYLINPVNNRIEIYYNDQIFPKGRIKFTLPHELGHICMGHGTKSGYETSIQKNEANIFANELYCPQAFMIYYRLRTKNDLISIFGITNSYAETLLSKLKQRKSLQLTQAELKLVRIFEKNKKIKNIDIVK